jgi:2-amino-4-hydroxy-6-hydroxymethyldihydropteridine diphosphokinase
LKEDEREIRVETIKFGPRIIDLDILTYADAEVNEEDLIIPHPHMREREFVQRGLRELIYENI